MRIALVFPPQASPTYVPLGIASLVSYLHTHVPTAQITVCDLNVALWRDRARQIPQGESFWDFMRGVTAGFFDHEAYTAHQPVWATLSEEVARLNHQARTYVQSGDGPASLMTLLDTFIETIRSNDPEVIGLSVMFLDQLPFALALAARMRQTGDRLHKVPPLILGGAAMSALHVEELLAAAPFVDAILPGEGERALALLCEGTPPAEIPGIRTLDAPASIPGVSRLPVTAEAIVAPDFGALDLSLYPNPTPVLPLVFSRDCDWGRCRFCAHNFSFHGYRQKNPAAFVDEIEDLMARCGASHFYLADQYVSARTLERLSDEILRRDLRLHFHLMARPTQDHTPARLAKASAAGCRWISWGIETGSQRLLNLVRKGTRREVIERLMHDSHQAGIANLMMMIFGLPTSTADDLEQTFDLIDQVYPSVAAIKSSSFVLFDGTPFARDAARFGLVVKGRQELLRIAGRPVHSSRLNFMTRASDGTLVPPPGPLEVSRWMQRRRWLGELSLLESLCCEHFLLYSAHAAASPDVSRDPVRPLPRKAA